MGRTLRTFGAVVLAATAWLFLAEGFGWIGSGNAGTWVGTGLRASVALLGLGLFLTMVPVERLLRRNRCARCGAEIEKGQTYCRDHLRSTLNEYRDRNRDGLQPRRGAPA